MNCQDLALILDDQGFDALDAGARSMAMAHLESCADCRRDRELHARLVARRVPPLPADLVADCRALVASSPQAGRGQRARSRFILIGTVAVVAAAAAMLVAYLWPEGGETDLAVESADASPKPVRTNSAPVAAADADRPGAESPQPDGPSFLVFVAPLADPDGPSAMSRDNPAFEVYEQVRAVNREPVRRNAMTSFRAAIINELNQVPGLGLVDSESRLIAATTTRIVPAYRLDVGGLTQLSPTGQPVVPDQRFVSVSINAWHVRPDGKAARAPGFFQGRIDLAGGCRTDPATGAVACEDAHSTAANLVRKMREQLFPPDPSIIRQRQARLLDGALDSSKRFIALQELLGIQSGGAPQAAAFRDPETVRGLLDLAATGEPALRARIWRAIRGTSDPDLLEALQASATSDADEPRIEAVATLAADFANDPRAQATLKSVADTDGRALVRALAQRGLTGEASWRSYLNASLQDAERPAWERVDAVAYQFGLPEHQQPKVEGQTFMTFHGMLDDAGVDVLAKLLPEVSEQRPSSEGTMVRIANAMAAGYRGNPAVTDALVYFLKHGRSTNARMTAVQMLGSQQRNDERVRSALRDALRSDPDQKVRDWVRQIMGEEFAADQP